MRDIIVTSAALRRSLDLGDYIPELERNGATAPPSTGPYSVGCDGLPVHSYGRYGTLAQLQEFDAVLRSIEGGQSASQALANKCWRKGGW